MTRSPQQNMLQFLLFAQRILVRIPRPWDGKELIPLPLAVLEVDEVEEQYSSLDSEERRCFAKQWDRFRALMQKQAELSAEATRLGQELTRCIPDGVSPVADGIIKELTVKDRLAAVIDELPLDPSAVLLEVARTLRRDAARNDDADDATPLTHCPIDTSRPRQEGV